ncbi:MAG: class I SAM-dependent methyltransferase [Bacteroidetes bacterium]|nr:class I SAM-dependent methyltransferase [Bacteroidota bacterium]
MKTLQQKPFDRAKKYYTSLKEQRFEEDCEDKIHNLSTIEFEQILSYKYLLLKNSSKLRTLDSNDYYWKELGIPKKLIRNGIFLETGMVISWIGSQRKPKKILEIGTRTGGSLIALLSVYKPEDKVEIEEILSFDLWREYISTTWVSSLLTKLLRKDSNINISMRYTRLINKILQNKAVKKVKKNLALFGINIDKIKFISGDSKKTVPDYFKMNPNKKFDYILVDGAHDELTAFIDLENIVNHTTENGIIVFDDIGPESYKLIGVWNKFKAKHIGEFDFFEIHHRKGIAWAVKK